MTIADGVSRIPDKSDDLLTAALPPGPLRRRIRRHSRLAVRLASGWIILLILISLTVQWLPIHSYVLQAGPPNRGLNWSHEFLGTDVAGRSMLSRLLFGVRISILISFSATAVSAIVGGLLGLWSAYFGPPISIGAEVISNSILSVPSLLLLIAIVLALTPTIPVIILACSVVHIPAFMRLTKANASVQLVRDYVDAARGLGASPRRIVLKELLPNTAPSLIAYGVLALPSVMILEGSLSFLGFGVQIPIPSWGNMIALGDPVLTIDPSQSIVPCVCLAFTVYSLNTIGDYVRARLTKR